MKTISIRGIKEETGIEMHGDVVTYTNVDEADDDYHTFDELYKHRDELFLALLRSVVIGYPEQSDYPSPLFVWRSKLHEDGTMFPGMFILGLTWERLKDGDFAHNDSMDKFDISYHLDLAYWDRCDEIQDNYGELVCKTLDRAPHYDGYSSNDVLLRLAKINRLHRR